MHSNTTDNPNGGSSIFLVTEDVVNQKFTYCCGEPTVADNGTITCLKNSAPFTLDTGEMLYGYAALENTTTTAPKSSSSRDVAIGAGVGVPLGVIAASAIAWAIWERMQRRKTLGAASGAAGFAGVAGAPAAGYGPIMKTDSYMPAIQNMPMLMPVELEQRRAPISELQGTHRM